MIKYQQNKEQSQSKNNQSSSKQSKLEKKGHQNNSLIKQATTNLLDTYKKCGYQYQQSIDHQKKVLTLPSTPVQDTKDNTNYDFICHAGDIVKNQKRKIQYQIVDILGKGSFGQVFLCQNQKKIKMAMKIIKSRPAYTNQGLLQAKVWKQWNNFQKFLQVEQSLENHCLKIYDAFMWHNHLFIVQQLLQKSILDILKQNEYEGINIKWIEKWTKGLLFSLFQVHSMGVIHCDIKPQNVMFRLNSSQKPVLLDFSCCCYQKKQVYTYIQSRFYRAPQVILGLKPYSDKIDIWSLGCMLVELYIGLPLFPGSCSYDQILKITQILGVPSKQMIDHSQFAHKYFTKNQQPRLLTEQEYLKENTQQLQMPQSKSYFKIKTLDDLLSNRESKNIQIHQLFINLIKKMLVLDPKERISASDAYLHPFCGGSISQLEQVQQTMNKMNNASPKKSQ